MPNGPPVKRAVRVVVVRVIAVITVAAIAVGRSAVRAVVISSDAGIAAVVYPDVFTVVNIDIYIFFAVINVYLVVI